MIPQRLTARKKISKMCSVLKSQSWYFLVNRVEVERDNIKGRMSGFHRESSLQAVPTCVAATTSNTKVLPPWRREAKNILMPPDKWNMSCSHGGGHSPANQGRQRGGQWLRPVVPGQQIPAGHKTPFPLHLAMCSLSWRTASTQQNTQTYVFLHGRKNSNQPKWPCWTRASDKRGFSSTRVCLWLQTHSSDTAELGQELENEATSAANSAWEQGQRRSHENAPRMEKDGKCNSFLSRHLLEGNQGREETKALARGWAEAAASPRGSHIRQAPRAGSGSCSTPGARSLAVDPALLPALHGDTSIVCLELSPSLLNPPPSFPFASINFLHFRQIPHFLRQIKSSGQGQRKWEDGCHLLEMFSVWGLFLACSGFPEPYFCCSHSSKKDFTKSASSHHLSSAHIPDVL